MLSCAIALAASGSGHALAVDLCTGQAATTVSSAASGQSCSLDVVDAHLTVTAGGAIDGGVEATSAGAVIGNSGLISGFDTAVYLNGVSLDGSLSNGGTIAGVDDSGYYAAGVYIDVDLSGELTNSGTISATNAPASSSADATALYISGNVSGKLVNSGTVSGVATAQDYNNAYAYGIDISGDVEAGATFTNSGTIKTEALSEGNYAYANSIYVSGEVAADVINTGTVSAKATSYASTASAEGIYAGSGVQDGGSITNNGTIDVEATGQDYAYGHGIDVSSVWNTALSRSVSLSGDASVVNNGSINVDTSSRWSQAESYGIDVDADLMGTSKVQNSATGVIRLNATSLDSTAYIMGISTGSLWDSASVVNNGQIILNAKGGNNSDATVYGIDVGDLNNSASLMNTGSISMTLWGGSDAYGYAITAGSLNDDATLVNSGTITATAHGETSYAELTGISTGSLYDNASITNSGAITLTSDGRGYGYAAAIDTGSLNGAASLTNTATLTATANSITSSATAYGIYTSGMYGADTVFSNSGAINVKAVGDTEARAYGIENSGNMDGSFTNTGKITVSAVAGTDDASAYAIYTGGMSPTTSTFTNSGALVVTATGESDASAYGIYMWSDMNGTLTNSGAITATATGATSSASAYGLYISGSMNPDTSVLTNTGAITLKATGDDYAYGYGLYVSGNMNGTLTNSAAINVTSVSDSYNASATGLHFGGMYDVDGSVTNTGTINVSATGEDYAYAYALGTWGDLQGSLSNSAAITATATVEDYYASAYGIYAGSMTPATSSLTNTGAIKATATGGEYVSAYGIYQSGTMNGALSNSATITATATGARYDATAYGIQAGSMNLDTAVLTNTGAITATATSEDYAWAAGLYQSGSMNGELTNSATIKATASGATYEGTAYGIQAGSMDVDTAVLTNTGAITATATGGEYGYAYGLYQYGNMNGTFTNSAAIVATAVGDTYSASAYGLHAGSLNSATSSLTNTGNITVSAKGDDYAYAYGLTVGTLNGSLSNSAAISAMAEVSQDTAYAEGISTGSMTSGSLVNTGALTVTAIGYSSATAYGITTGSLSTDSLLSNSGAITVTATDQTSSAEAYGISAGSLSGTSALTNTGRITATADGEIDAYAYAYGISLGTVADDADLSNSAVITAKANSVGYSGYAYGIYMGETYNNATVANTGAIVATATGGLYEGGAYGIYSWGSFRDNTQVTNSGDIVAVADGQTSAYAYGIRSGGLTGTSSITNSGDITAMATNRESSSAFVAGVYAPWMYDTSSITNSGNITAVAINESLVPDTYATAYGIFGFTYNNAAAGTSITNSGDISVYAEAGENGEAYAYGIYDGASYGNITNSGTIDASIGSTSGSAWGIYASGSGGTITNTGTIIGGVYAGGKSLVNNGVIVSNTEENLVSGNYTQGADASYGFVLRNASEYGRLKVNGTADFTASNKILLSMDPRAAFTGGEVLADVVNAATLTVTGPIPAFDVEDQSLFWDLSVVNEDANGFDVQVTAVSPTAVLGATGMTLSASQASLLTDALTGGLSSDYADLVAALNTARTAADAARVVEQVGPALAGAGSFATRVSSAPATNAISARMGEARGASSGDAFSKNAVWIKPFLGMASQDAANGVSGFDVDTTGFVIGVDGDVSDAARVGVAVASAQSNGDGDNAGLDIDTTQFTLYGSYALGSATSLDADLSYGANSYDSTRNVGFAGSRAVANYDGTQLALGATLSHRMSMGEKAALVPALSLRFSSVDIDGYTETGATPFNLAVAGTSDDAILLAAKAGYELTMSNKGVFLANLGLGYDTIDRASATASLGGGSGPTFVSNGIEPDAMIVSGGLGYRYVTSKNLEINAAYDLESRSDFLGQTLSVKFRMPF